ncbi:DUF1294 domain-containing protein [Sphingopyxis sp. MSC1_008]|jgi:uncharacterized membrane protein YsdA (DUF1294 family)|uniref:DUF1294 domain-containing protein n=1 Tax=Sphingopyxis sp. MSC1_008 TaxID=2909265 RepID=UPI0020C00D4C|nr:DUF1294 domain-containing protein [Sphingopyxis sp. MSC1_008]
METPLGEYIVYWLIAANLIAFVLMVVDKQFAENGSRRISESTLLGWAFIGGAIGTFAGSRLIRHKTRKQPFARRMVMLCAAEIVLLGLWMLGFLDQLLHH